MASDNGTSTGKFTELRRRAQAYLSAPTDKVHSLSQEDVKKLVHELDTYQVELELQNEDLQKAQEEINKSRKRFSDLYDFAPVGYLTVSDKGLILEANLTAANLLGLERQYLLKQPLSAFIVDEDQDIHYRCRKKLLNTGMPQTCNFRLRKNDGTQFHAQLNSSVDAFIDGGSGQFRTVITDISEQKKLEQAIWQSKKEWENTFDAMADIVTLMDKNLRIVRANKVAHDFFKVKPGELNGRHCYELFRGDTAPCHQCPITKTLQSSGLHCAENMVHERLGKIFQVSSAPVFDENGELQHLVHVAKDITEIKKLEEELFQSHKMEAMGTLAGGIAHDFNNILAAILGYSEMIKDKLPDSSPLKKYINQVLKSGKRATDLVKQILTFSRKSQGSKNEQLYPQIIVKEVLKMLHASLPTTIELRDDIDPQCGTILVDPTNLHQVILNVCTNAFHAMENEKGVITVRLSNKTLGPKEVGGEAGVTPGLFVELVVKDTGTGMEHTLIEHIFEPYYTTKGIGKGSGIGLAVVHGIVKKCGGMIKVESEVGKGSTFRIYFPCVEAQLHEEGKGKDEDILPSGTESILAVDDEEMIVSYLKACLDSLGYKVTAHTRSVEALEDFSSRPSEFDLVITDQTMPSLSGLELSKKMLDVRNDIPIILCTGYSSMISGENAND